MAEVYRSRRRALAFLYVTLALVTLTALLTSPALSIKQIHLEGLAALPAAEADATVRAATLPPDTNWLRFAPRRMEAQLRTLPWVRSAQVARSFPNALAAQVSLRTPSVLVQTETGLFETDDAGIPIRLARREVAGRLLNLPAPPPASALPEGFLGGFGVAANGQALFSTAAKDRPTAFPTPETLWPSAPAPTVATGPEPILPLVVLEGPRPVRPGVPFHDPALNAAIQILHAARRDGVVRIAKIEVDQSDNMCLNMEDGLPIQFGQVEDYPAKLTLVRRIYRQEPDIARRLAAINVSCPSWPACTPRSPSL
jgi:cell division septal protein FtsQ